MIIIARDNHNHTPFVLSPLLDGCCSTKCSTLSSSPNKIFPKRGLRTLFPAVFLRPINKASIDSRRVPWLYKQYNIINRYQLGWNLQ